MHCELLIFSRILPFGPEGPKWQDCFDTFCARAQKVQNKGWRSTALIGVLWNISSKSVRTYARNFKLAPLSNFTMYTTGF